MQTFITLLIILMGISCFSAQVLFIREFLIQFYGNELTIGLILANWLILEAIGSFIFGLFVFRKKLSVYIYAITQFLICILLPLSIFVARIIKTLLDVTSGQGFSIISIFVVSFLVMAPLGFLLGAQFPLISSIYKNYIKKSLSLAVGKSYFFEAIGFGSSGVIVTYFLIPHINSIAIAFIIGWINLICGCLLLILTVLPSNSIKRRFYIKIVCIFLITVGIATYVKYVPFLHDKSIKIQWKNFNIMDYTNSIYGNIAVIKQAEQNVFYYDGIPFMTAPIPDVVFTEDLVNFSLTAKDPINNVAIIGSGLGGIINNVIQYPVKRIDYAEIDPIVIQTAKKHSGSLIKKELSDSRLKIHNVDGRIFLKKTKNKFDLVIINLPIPSTLVINRFYTKEFFQIIRNKLNPKGLICLSLPGTLSYLSDEQIDINKCIFKTLKTVFAKVEIIPGHKNIYLATTNTDFKLKTQKIIKGLEKNKIKSTLFNEFYIKDRLAGAKQSWFIKSLEKRQVRINRDLEPTAVFYSLGLWNALFSPGFQKIFRLGAKLNLSITIIFISIFFISCILLFLLLKSKLRIKSSTLFIPAIVLSTGFSGVSLNLVALLALQTFYGYVYLHIGILLSSFMFGMTIGGILVTKNLNRKFYNKQKLLKTDLLFTIFCLSLYPILKSVSYLVNIELPFLLLLFIIICGICGFFVGFEFPLSNKIYLANQAPGKTPVNILYAIDMLGSFFGAVLISVILVPVIGILNTIIIIFLIKLCLLSALRITGVFKNNN